jgi:vanillin dehydrogenase
MEEIKFLIAGRDAPAAKSATFDRLDPISGDVATRAAAATAADAKAAGQRFQRARLAAGAGTPARPGAQGAAFA